MERVHFLNVGEGDCSIIQHGSGRVSMIDICNGNVTTRQESAMFPAEMARSGARTTSSVRSGSGNNVSARQRLIMLLAKMARIGARTTSSVESRSGNYGMRKSPTDPIAYLKGLGVPSVFRFILTHPDMDHLDGFKRLCDEVGIRNFWDSGVRRAKPNFSGGRYQAADWEQYVKVRDGKAGVWVVAPLAGSRFRYANEGPPDDRGDCLSIVSPNSELGAEANDADDPNDASYVVVYRTCGGNIVFPGDAHDRTWEYVLDQHEQLVRDCAVLIAPHHGRASDRCYDFLDTLNPKLSLFGCADSEDLAYDAWKRRGLPYITNNQAGNVILDAVSSGIDVYVENRAFAETFPGFDAAKLLNGCFYIGQVTKP